MAYILNIETATKNCSVSIALEGKTIACKEISENGYSHAEKLHLFIEEVVKESKINLKNLDAIAVSQGPGSYTGLRIGISSAKGLCYGLNIPLIALDTLNILAKQIHIENGLIIPMIDARRMECYTAIYNEKQELLRTVEAEIIDENTYNKYDNTIHFLGDGASKCEGLLKGENLIFHKQNIFPSANEMSILSYEKYKKKDFEDVAYFEPFYLKEFLFHSSTK